MVTDTEGGRPCRGKAETRETCLQAKERQQPQEPEEAGRVLCQSLQREHGQLTPRPLTPSPQDADRVNSAVLRHQSVVIR